MRTPAQQRAVDLHLKRMRKQATDAKRQYEQFRAAFPEYANESTLMPAARYVDEVQRGVEQFASWAQS
jgi:hypothetical protein